MAEEFRPTYYAASNAVSVGMMSVKQRAIYDEDFAQWPIERQRKYMGLPPEPLEPPKARITGPVNFPTPFCPELEL